MARSRRQTVFHDQTVGAAVEKLARAVGRPGLKPSQVRNSASVPLFRAHPRRPGVLIRYAAGKTVAGRINAAGKFVPEK